MSGFGIVKILITIINVLSFLTGVNSCTALSVDAGCAECTEWGACVPGSLPIDPWLDFALRTQYEIQIDEPFDNLQLIDLETERSLTADEKSGLDSKSFLFPQSHNSYNNRADGYGKNDSCEWPPPYKPPCYGLANHEFSVTDQLNMGIRGIELDPWYCYDQMRLAHLGTPLKLGCLERHKLFSDGVQEIADFLTKPENVGQIIRIYMNEKVDQAHDDLINGPFQVSFGSRALTPADLTNLYGGKWPTMRKMRKDGKNVVIVFKERSDGTALTHGDVFIHRYNWTNIREYQFTPYPLCGGKTPDTGPWRVYSDSTFYTRVYSGPDAVGCILDYTELMKCHIHFPASDHTNSQLMRSAVFTWDEGEPSSELGENSCVFLSPETQRWRVVEDCQQDFYFACQHIEEKNEWTVSDVAGPYEVTNGYCPYMYKFSLPTNGYMKQKLLEAAEGKPVWINYGPWLPGYVEPEPNFSPTTESKAVKLGISFFMLFIVCLVQFCTSHL